MVNTADNLGIEAGRSGYSVCCRVSMGRWSGLFGEIAMFKFRRLLCAVLVCALVGIAYGAATKIGSFCPRNGENPSADGMAILNYVPGDNRTVVQLIVSNFSPGVTYNVEFVGLGIIGSAFMTDSQGNGNFHWNLGGNFSGAINLYLTMADGANGELRAVSGPCS